MSPTINVESLPAHLRKYEIAPGGCWIFQHRSPNGYAHNTSAKGKKGSAYKLIWEHFNGPVPAGLELDHLCDNGPGGCVNPRHLKAVTHKENCRRSRVSPTAINARKTHCERGHELTPDNIIRQTKKAGGGRECKRCRRERNKKWAEQNRERANELSRASYWRNHERSLELAAKKRERHRERRRAANRAYYQRKKAEGEAS